MAHPTKPNGSGDSRTRILLSLSPQNRCRAWERKFRVMPDNVALFAAIILLLPMIYFLLASPVFLLVRLDIPAVALLLRAMFSGYFLAVGIAGVIGAMAVALAGRLVLAIAIGFIAVLATSSRRWFLRQMDDRITDRDAGNAGAVSAATTAAMGWHA
jgi:hypothetical protein